MTPPGVLHRRLVRWALGLLLVMPWSVWADGFSGSFQLEVARPGEIIRSQGRIELASPGAIYLEITSPIPQRAWLHEGTLTFFWPEQGKALTARVEPTHEALLFDALSWALLRPGAAPLRLISTDATPEGLRQRWELVDGRGRVQGVLDVQEGPGGITRMALSDPEGRVLRRYFFGPRVEVEGQHIPTTIEAEYFDPSGAPRRAERWSLSGLTPLPSPDTRRVGKAPTLPPGVVPGALRW